MHVDHVQQVHLDLLGLGHMHVNHVPQVHVLQLNVDLLCLGHGHVNIILLHHFTDAHSLTEAGTVFFMALILNILISHVWS